MSIFLATHLVLPTDPAQRRLRIALAVGDSLRAALADKDKLHQPSASEHYDRLAQYKVWLGKQTATPARLKTMQRLVDIGNLATAVRRSWRSLDAARPDIEARVDAEARKLLPSLSPEETMAMAGTYLDAAKGKTGRPALRLVHAAAALYGTSILTTTEMRLLDHVELLRRKDMREFVVAGLLISPFVKFALIAAILFVPLHLILVRSGFHKWFWHPAARGGWHLRLPFGDAQSSVLKDVSMFNRARRVIRIMLTSIIVFAGLDRDRRALAPLHGLAVDP